MTLFTEIQKRVKEGQDALLATSKTMLEHADVQKVLSQAQELTQTARSSVEDLRSQVETRVRDAEAQGRTFVREGLNQAVDASRRIEGQAVEAANRALDEGEKFVQANVPFLAAYVQKAKEAVKLADDQFNKLQARVSAGTNPIPGYDKLNAKAAAVAVKKLTVAELHVIRAYEQANKARATVLAEIDSLLAAN